MSSAGWILVVTLGIQGSGLNLGPQADCSAAGEAWMQKAIAWQRRSGLPGAGGYRCLPPNAPINPETPRANF